MDGRRAGPFRAWSDTKAKKLEAHLHEVDQGVIDGSEEIRAQRLEDARRREEQRPAALRRAEAERLRQEEEARVAQQQASLDGNILCRGGGLGIGSRVTGIKVDVVDDVGANEIWAGDAVGHIYLFRRHAGTSPTWDCIFRSEDLGAYVGRYNGIYPIKDVPGPGGHTVRLVVMTAGYVYAFDVNYQLGAPPP